MTHRVEGLCSRLFCGIELFEIFVGILVERFDATFAAKTDQPAFVQGIDCFAHSAQAIVRNNTGCERIAFGQVGSFRLIFRSFDDLGGIRCRRLVFFGMARAEGAKEKANEEKIGFRFHLSILNSIYPATEKILRIYREPDRELKLNTP